MLAGVNVVKDQVVSGRDLQALAPTEHTGVAQRNSQAAAATSTMTPQLMILPLPLDPAAAQLPGIYDPAHPLTLWMLARGTPIGLAPVRMTQVAQQALSAIPREPAQ
jgi:hypothetical protein